MSSKSTFSGSTSKSYALALYELGEENSELNKIEEEAKGIKKLLFESNDFKEMILSPTISPGAKKNIMFSLADKNHFSKTLKNFLGYLSNKNRLFFLGNIFENFLNLVSKNKGELKAKLTSSKELSLEDKKKVELELSENFKSPLNIEYKYDPELIAGLIIQVGSIMVDTSIKTKLQKLESNMIEA